jgi:hypothetical protein
MAGPPEVVKTTVRLPVALWRAVKVRAVDERRDLQDVIIAALTAYVGQSLPRSKKGGPR